MLATKAYERAAIKAAANGATAAARTPMLLNPAMRMRALEGLLREFLGAKLRFSGASLNP